MHERSPFGIWHCIFGLHSCLRIRQSLDPTNHCSLSCLALLDKIQQLLTASSSRLLRYLTLPTYHTYVSVIIRGHPSSYPLYLLANHTPLLVRGRHFLLFPIPEKSALAHILGYTRICQSGTLVRPTTPAHTVVRTTVVPSMRERKASPTPSCTLTTLLSFSSCRRQC